MVGETTNSMKLMASLAPVRAEIEAGVVAKADQYFKDDLCSLVIVWIGGVCFDV